MSEIDELVRLLKETRDLIERRETEIAARDRLVEEVRFALDDRANGYPGYIGREEAQFCRKQAARLAPGGLPTAPRKPEAPKNILFGGAQTRFDRVTERVIIWGLPIAVGLFFATLLWSKLWPGGKP